MAERVKVRIDGSFIMKMLLTVLVLVFAWYRRPELLTEPRFWAEEGSDYFRYAFNHSWLRNLFHPQFGYNTLYNSIATSLAASLPLENAPYATTYLAFFVQVAVSSLVIWWDIPKLDSLLKKFIVALAIQYLAYARIWTTTIGVQYWLCVSTFLILLHNAEGNRPSLTWLKRFLLVHNGLTGVLSCFMIPAFLLKWFRTRSRETAVHAAILCASFLVQVSVYGYFLANGPLSNRMTYCSPLYMLSKFLRFQFQIPFSGQLIMSLPVVEAKEIALRKLLYPLVGEGIFQYQYMIIEQIVAVLILLFMVVLAVKTRKQLETQLFVVSFILVATLSTIFSINMSGGPRYTFAPSIMLMIFIVGMAGGRQVSRPLRAVAILLITTSLVSGIYEYRMTMMGFSYHPHWPKWRDEAARWRANGDYELKIWPPPWSIKLSGTEDAAGIGGQAGIISGKR